ncbi:MAG: cupin [Rhodospirillales bacterium]|nr:cupin [Rhodospirillales bacterium]
MSNPKTILCSCPVGCLTRPRASRRRTSAYPSQSSARSSPIIFGSFNAPLTADQDAVKNPHAQPPPNPFPYSLAGGPAKRITKDGRGQIAQSHKFMASVPVAAGPVTVHPDRVHEIHGHLTADKRQYYVNESAQMTVFTGRSERTTGFNPGDIGYIQRNLSQYIKNIGDTDLVFPQIFKSDSCLNRSPSNWLIHIPAAVVSAHFNVSAQEIADFPKKIPDPVPS